MGFVIALLVLFALLYFNSKYKKLRKEYLHDQETMHPKDFHLKWDNCPHHGCPFAD